MKTNRIFRLLQVLTILYAFPIMLPAQPAQEEDVSVKFSFNKPNEYVCEIRNMTKYLMSILLGKEEIDGRSDLHFDYANGSDTIRDVFRPLMKKIDQSRFLRLDPGQAYTVSYKEGSDWEFIKASIYIGYGLMIPDTEPKS
ncbi:MAG: hypothetical protein LBS52_00005, partial [Dysgonamonadaceae bacterium]|nr:hypothetical protein [Dysgonamonadaceae bacterium]